MNDGSPSDDNHIEFLGASLESHDLSYRLMAYETVAYTLENRVATIQLNRPEALNALSLQLAKDLLHAVQRTTDDGARAVILTGSGRAFCSGGDLREMRAMGESEKGIEAFLDEPLKALHEVILLIRQTPIPFIAAVNGVCAGAGTNFALACDLVVAADDASFNEAFVRIGLSPDCGGTFFLPRAIGEKLAAEAFMLGMTISAQRAAEIGMINRVVPASELMKEAGKLAASLAGGPTAVYGRIKRMLNATFSNDLAEQLKLEADCQVESGQSTDFKEGVSAFFEKRPPQFTGE
jgi:2-(1,2-epoxy-1,2-dihydrophenyl)acetyl-CoA isomerase